MRTRHRTAFLITGLLLLASCAGELGSPQSNPSVSASPSVAASPSATAAETPAPPPPLGRLSLAVVLVDDLEVSLAPSTDAAILNPPAGLVRLPLQSGDRVLVIDGPVSAEGLDWYSIGLEVDPSLNASVMPAGWIPAGSSDAPSVVADTTPCPEPTIQALRELSGVVRLGCYGSTSFAFDAHQAESPGGIGGACFVELPEPAWLMCDNIYNFVNTDGGTAWDLLLHFDPASGITPTGLAPMGTTGSPLRITGHFNDPAADACIPIDPQVVTELSQWLTCAARFVAEGVEPGT